MSYYEELLTLGQHLHEEERAALYKFLRLKNDLRYADLGNSLLNLGQARESVAGGEIIFSLKGSTLSYSARKNGSNHLFEDIRQTKLGVISSLNRRKIMDFIAQAEVEVIWNFPLPGENPQENSGYTVISFPFSDLRYYSHGKSRILGLLKKLSIDDSEIMNKLMAS